MEEESANPVQYAGIRSEAFSSSAQVIGYVGIKLMGLYLLVMALPQMVYFFYRYPSTWQWDQGSLNVSALLAFLLMSIVPAVGLVMILLARWLSLKLISTDRVIVSYQAGDQMVLLVSLGVGLLIAATALPSAAHALLLFGDDLRARRLDFPGLIPSLFQKHHGVLTYGGQVIVGVFLFLCPGWVVGQYRRRSKQPESVA